MTNPAETTQETEEAAEEMATMKPREIAGAINRARRVLVFVMWGPGECGEGYYQISKEAAREIVAHAKEAGLSVSAEMDGRDLLIGPCDAEEPEEGGEGGEEEEEESEEEEEVE